MMLFNLQSLHTFIGIGYAAIGLLCATAQANPNIQQFLNQEGKDVRNGRYPCAFKKVKASKPCTVRFALEAVTHPDVLAFYGAGKKGYKLHTLTVTWPDATRSKFAFGDSREMLNLEAPSVWGYSIALKNAEFEIDWSRGFVINQGKQEYLRVWN